MRKRPSKNGYVTSTIFDQPLPSKVVARRREMTDYMLALAAGAPAVCRTNNVWRDWAQAIEEDEWRDFGKPQT